MKSLVATYSQRYKLQLTYSVAILAPFVSFTALLLLENSSFHLSQYLFFFPAITLSGWYGGVRTGVLTTILSTLGSVFFLFPLSLPLSIQEAFGLLEIGLFTIEGIGISAALEFYRRSDLQSVFRKKEKTYQREITQLELEKIKAQEEIKARDEFLSIASHELRTPLTSMVLQLQTALHSIRNVSLAQFSVENLMTMLQRTEKQSQRLTKMINDLLNVSLITTGRFDLELENADLKDIVSDVIDRFSERLQKERNELFFSADTSVPIRCDRVRIEQVISNLISNAIKYGNGKPIMIKVEKKQGNGIIIVQDHGIGIPRDKQELIFGRFKRAITEPNYKGLGVGLYISEQIVKAHNGTLQVKSKSAKGSTFIVWLPGDGPAEESKN